MYSRSLGPWGVRHDAQEEHPLGVQAVLLETLDRGDHQFPAHALHVLGLEEGEWAEDAHAAGVGTQVVLEDALVVLAGGQEGVMGMVSLHVHQDVQAQFHAHQGFLKDHGLGGLPELAGHEVAEGLQRLLARGSQDHTLARRQAVGLEDDGIGVGPGVDQGLALGQIGHGFAGGAGDGMALHEVLGEGLGALQAGRGGIVAENRDPQGPEGIAHTGDQGRLGAEDRQVRPVL